MPYFMVASAASQTDTLIGVLDKLVTAIAGYVTTWVSTIFASGNELLLVFIVLPLIGVGISIIARLTSNRL